MEAEKNSFAIELAKKKQKEKIARRKYEAERLRRKAEERKKMMEAKNQINMGKLRQRATLLGKLSLGLKTSGNLDKSDKILEILGY